MWAAGTPIEFNLVDKVTTCDSRFINVHYWYFIEHLQKKHI